MSKPLFGAMLAISAMLSSGCQEVRLRDKTDRLSGSVTDLYYQQTLNNLAMMHADPGRLPYLGLPNQGTATIQNALQASYTPNWDLVTASGRFFGHYFNDKNAAAFQGSTQTAETWQTQPTTTPEKLALMKFAYLKTLGENDPRIDYYINLFRSTYSSPFGFLDALQPGWYCVGSKNDMPKDAVHHGHYGTTYVWVMPNNTEPLSRFVLAIMDIATAAPKQGDPFFPRPNPAEVQAAQKTGQDSIMKAKNFVQINTNALPDQEEGVITDRLNELSSNLTNMDSTAGLQNVDRLLNFVGEAKLNIPDKTGITSHLNTLRQNFSSLNQMSQPVQQQAFLIQPRTNLGIPYPAPPVAPAIP